jgi:transcriptional regulator with XRE-family HTH domain
MPADAPTRALGAEVRALRERRGLTQRQLAQALGWDQPQVARLEAGAVTPNLATLQLLADRLGLVITVAPSAAPALRPTRPEATG